MNHWPEQLRGSQRLPSSNVGRLEEEEFQERMIKGSVLDLFLSVTESYPNEHV